MTNQEPSSGRNGAAHAARLRRIERLEYWLERRFRVPFLRLPVGFDGLLGLVPALGDTVAAALAAYLIYEAHQAGADRRTRLRMIRNAALDYGLGLVPVVGTVADFFYRSNSRNLAILKEHLRSQERQPSSDEHARSD